MTLPCRWGGCDKPRENPHNARHCREHADIIRARRAAQAASQRDAYSRMAAPPPPADYGERRAWAARFP